MPTKKAAKKSEKPAKKAASPAKRASPAPAPKPRPAAPKPTYAPPPKPATPTTPPPPAPEFVKNAPFADRKAAIEALAEKEGVAAVIAPSTPAVPAPTPPPPFVRDASPGDRKAAMEQVVVEQGVSGLLAKAPWKRGPPTPPPTPAPTPALPAERTGPRVQMTQSPIETTTGRSAPQQVILDSNALMMQFQFHIDIEKEVNRLLNGNYQYVVPQIVIDELGRISKEGGGKEAAEARMAIELAKTFEIMESPGAGDTGILRLAEKINAIVVTNDKKLRAQLRAKDIANIYMRSRAFLTVDGHIPGM